MERSLTNILGQPSIDVCGFCGQKSGGCICLKFEQQAKRQGLKLNDQDLKGPLQTFNPYAQTSRSESPTDADLSTSAITSQTDPTGLFSGAQGISSASNSANGMGSGPP